MDLQWLLPEQIQQILKFCQLSSLDDLTVAASILQSHHWNIENALRDVNSQKNDIRQREEQKLIKPSNIATEQNNPLIWNNSNHHGENEFEVASQDYHQFIDHSDSSHKPSFQHHSSILAQQNMEYEQMGHQMTKQKQQQKQQQLKWKIYTENKEKQFVEGQKQFENRKISDPLAIKFRLVNGTSQFIFSHKETIETVIAYVNCCLRDSFDNRYADFELTQNYPPLKLKNNKERSLSDVFGESTGEVIIVKEIDQ